MGFRELIKQVQDYSGFSDTESKDALECMVENLAVRLTEGERKNFASQLPEELQDIALAVEPSEENMDQDIVAEFMLLEDIDEPHAKKQIFASWKALRDAVSPGIIAHIEAQLPNKTVALLGQA
jgi:uncharacterized protein (DUF2267 family)